MKLSLLILLLVAVLAPTSLFAKKAEGGKAVPAKELRSDFDYANDAVMRYFDSRASYKSDRLPQKQGDPRSPQSMPVTQSGQNTANPPTIPLFK